MNNLCQLNIEGLQSPLEMHVHDQRDQHVSRGIATEGLWEPYETQLVIQRLKPGDVFIDVGANIGYYSLIASTLVGASGSVISFEPDPANYHLLMKNLQVNNLSNVNAINAALSDVKGEGSLYLSTNNFGDHQIYDNGDERKKSAIQLLNGSEVLGGIDNITLVKIDTQGAEYHVLKGLLPILRKQPHPLSLIVEFWPFGLRKAGASADKLLDLLSELDLPFSAIDHVGFKLAPCSESALREWVAMVESDPNDEGFMNILLGK